MQERIGSHSNFQNVKFKSTRERWDCNLKTYKVGTKNILIIVYTAIYMHIWISPQHLTYTPSLSMAQVSTRPTPMCLLYNILLCHKPPTKCINKLEAIKEASIATTNHVTVKNTHFLNIRERNGREHYHVPCNEYCKQRCTINIECLQIVLVKYVSISKATIAHPCPLNKQHYIIYFYEILQQ